MRRLEKMWIVIRLVGSLFIIIGLVGLAVMLAGAGASAGLLPIDVLIEGPIQRVIRVVGVLIPLISPVYVVAGVALLLRASWARPIALAVATMGVFSFPIGTLAALVTFALLVRPGVKELFESSGSSRPATGPASTAAVTEPPSAPQGQTGDAASGESLENPQNAIASIAFRVEMDDLIAFAEAPHDPLAGRAPKLLLVAGNRCRYRARSALGARFPKRWWLGRSNRRTCRMGDLPQVAHRGRQPSLLSPGV